MTDPPNFDRNFTLTAVFRHQGVLAEKKILQKSVVDPCPMLHAKNRTLKAIHLFANHLFVRIFVHIYINIIICDMSVYIYMYICICEKKIGQKDDL